MLPTCGAAAGSSSASSASSASSSDAPHSFEIKSWGSDSFAKGSYSAVGVQDPGLYQPSALEDFEGFVKFAEPVGGFIFAGEHTQSNRGYMESAVRSGLLRLRRDTIYLILDRSRLRLAMTNLCFAEALISPIGSFLWRFPASPG
ncbi:MAG: hypothetical protein ACD_69C00199G0006 [uncultured bacterium]|nr:MAG: hypothetical protein ACD_69C00199G0006 [uncultured bacterium]OGT08483.1 MAG: hypothetical protein A2V89_04660 [Gammaproteobacteria bacterium RBG_16_37_9]HBC71917.1 hypothetical protein [Coxiellaceae bacterium]HBY55914.1 hypothetical protein [Coxiellaceae bacterium]